MTVPPQLALFPDTAFPHPAQRSAKPPAGSALPPDRDLTIRPDTLPEGVQWQQVELDGHTIGYQLKRSRRRTLGLTINDNGLTVALPSWVKLSQAEQVLHTKSAWILRKLREYQQRREQLALQSLQWVDGDMLPFMGVPIRLSLNPQIQQVQFEGQISQAQHGQRLSLPLPVHAEAQRVQELTQAWLQKQARLWFEQRLAH